MDIHIIVSVIFPKCHVRFLEEMSPLSFCLFASLCLSFPPAWFISYSLYLSAFSLSLDPERPWCWTDAREGNVYTLSLSLDPERPWCWTDTREGNVYRQGFQTMSWRTHRVLSLFTIVRNDVASLTHSPTRSLSLSHASCLSLLLEKKATHCNKTVLKSK